MAITQNYSPSLTIAALSTIFGKTVANLTVSDIGTLRDVLKRQTDHTSTDTLSTIFTNSAGPTVTAAALTTGPVFVTGNTVTFTVTFSDLVYVTGTPRIAITGLTSKYANYASGTGTNTLTFNYTVVSGDSAIAGGITVSTSGLTLNSGTIKDQTPGNNATLTLPAINMTSVTFN